MPSEKKKGAKAKKAVLWAFVLAAIFVFWQRLPRPPSVPGELIGTWRTDDPRYADRSLEIGITIIDFGTGDGTVTTGFIQKVEAVPEAGRTLYTISYLQDGIAEQCSFYYTSEREKTIYFKNQPSIPWIKDKET